MIFLRIVQVRNVDTSDRSLLHVKAALHWLQNVVDLLNIVPLYLYLNCLQTLVAYIYPLLGCQIWCLDGSLR